MAKGLAKGLADSDGIIFKTIPPNKYEARVSKVEDKQSGDSSTHPGTPMVKVSLRITHEDPAIDGNIISNHMMLPYADWMTEEDTRKQLAALKRMYVACGLELDDDEYDTDDWMGQELVVVVTESEYPKGSGKMTNNVSDVLPSD